MSVGLKIARPGEFVSTDEAARILGMTPGRVCQLLRAGEMQGQKIGRRVWVIPRAEVERIKRIPQKVGRPRIGR